MKKTVAILTGIILLISMNSCGVNNALMINQNNNSTEVHLTTNNYRVVEKVSGNAEVNYVLFFGGMNKTQLFENAYAAMVDNADLESGSRALINVVSEDHVGGVPPLFYKRTVTFTAHVIEFTR